MACSISRPSQYYESYALCHFKMDLVPVFATRNGDHIEHANYYRRIVMLANLMNLGACRLNLWLTYEYHVSHRPALRPYHSYQRDNFTKLIAPHESQWRPHFSPPFRPHMLIAQDQTIRSMFASSATTG